MKKNKLLIGLFAIGLFILLYPYLAQYINNKLQASTAKEYEENLNLMSIDELTKMLKQAKICNEAIYNNEELVYDPFTIGHKRTQFEACKDAPLNGDLVATIEIPSLKLLIPIYLGAGEDSLSRGIGQVEGSSLPIGGTNTHTVLAGHRGMGSKEMFKNTDKLKSGDLFYIHTFKNTLAYKIFNKDIVLPNETENLVIQDNKDLASLVTCHPYGENSHRLIIQGERIKKKNVQ